MNSEAFNNQIFGVLSSYRAKPLERIQTHLMRRADGPSQDQLHASLPNQLNMLLDEEMIQVNGNGYKLNPFHPIHSQVVPNIEEMMPGRALEAANVTIAGQRVRFAMEDDPDTNDEPEPETTTTTKRRGRSRRSSTRPAKKVRGRSRSRSRSNTRKGRGKARKARR